MKQFFEDLLFVLFTIVLVGFVFFGNMAIHQERLNKSKMIKTKEKIVINYKVLAQIESSNNPKAYNKYSGAIGLFQITHICLSDYNSIRYHNVTMNDLYNPDVNYKVASWYLEVKIPEYLKYYKIEDTLENRLVCYHAGIQAVVLGKWTKETVNYLKKYKELNHVGSED